MEKKSNAFKIVVLGEVRILTFIIARVGKTSLTVRFCKNEFDDKQESTLDASCLEKTVTIPGSGQNVKLVIWDTAGQERYHALNPVYYRGAEGALVVYDITDIDSFEKVKTWVNELRKYLPAETPILIAGNKCDINNRQIDLDVAEQYARSVGSEHFNSSAKTGLGVNQVFISLAEKIIEMNKNKKSAAAKPKVNTRGVLKVDGYADFNPDLNVQLSVRKSIKQKDEKKGKCCK